jgi:hypothetical protein
VLVVGVVRCQRDGFFGEGDGGAGVVAAQGELGESARHLGASGVDGGEALECLLRFGRFVAGFEQRARGVELGGIDRGERRRDAGGGEQEKLERGAADHRGAEAVSSE